MFRSGSIHDRICKPFPVGRRPPPSPGIDLYHFRRKKDITVLTFSLVSRSGVPSSLALPRGLFFISIRDELRSGLEHRIEQGMPVSKLSLAARTSSPGARAVVSFPDIFFFFLLLINIQPPLSARKSFRQQVYKPLQGGFGQHLVLISTCHR